VLDLNYAGAAVTLTWAIMVDSMTEKTVDQDAINKAVNLVLRGPIFAVPV